MKKNLKSLVGIAMAATMAIAGTVTSFGAEAFKISGTIADKDVTIDCALPTAGTLQIKPFAVRQIGVLGGGDANAPEAGKGTSFQNKPTAEDGSEASDIDLSIVGYTAVLKSASSANAMSLKSSYTEMKDYGDSTKKEVSLKIQLSGESDDVAADEKDGKLLKIFTAADNVKEADIVKASTADFDKTKSSSTYTKLEAPITVKVAAEGYGTFNVVGTMNPNATWEAGDSISVTPVYKVAAHIEAGE